MRHYCALLLLLLAGSALANTGGAHSEAASLWPRIVQGLRMGEVQRPEVRLFADRYAANPRALATMLQRSEPYLWFIVETAELRELPMELALLPAVESGYNAHARSVAAATGLWQFIPRTGSIYGLKESASYDGRRDPVASTRAALSYLHLLHSEFGDWQLALAAYNAGSGRVREAMRRANSRDYWSLPLPQETREYVPRLLALAAIVRSPEQYGMRLPAMSNIPATELVTLSRDISLPAALRAAQLDHGLVRRYNPGVKQLLVKMDSPTLMLPPTDALVLRAELAQAAALRWPPILAAAAPQANRIPDPLGLRSAGPVSSFASPPTPLRSALRIVQAGETLFALARENGISVDSLRRANGLDSGGFLAAGAVLHLP